MIISSGFKDVSGGLSGLSGLFQTGFGTYFPVLATFQKLIEGFKGF